MESIPEAQVESLTEVTTLTVHLIYSLFLFACSVVLKHSQGLIYCI